MPADPEIDSESFRDRIATAEKSGKRIWLFPQKPKGKLYNARQGVALLLLAFLFSGPFIRLGGDPLLLLNVFERRFVFFGFVFGPQDFYILVIATLAFFIFIVLFTAVLGRLFCGWICPQTIFMEMVFRRLDYWIDGNPRNQKKLDRAPWGISKISRRILKHAVFFILSVLICNMFLSYIIGAEKTIELISRPPWVNLSAFAAMSILSFLFYGVFAWFREQACTLVCPYGRLQSVLIDSNTIAVAYDYKRGEPRRKLSRNEPANNAGDCIDCKACIRVCPTGIDIRDGTQLECVNCTACIDACNSVMAKVKRPRGLIRYSSENMISGAGKKLISGRVYVYAAAMVLLVSLTVGLTASRSDLDTVILKALGTTFIEGQGNSIRNLYTVRVINKTSEKVNVSLRLKSPPGGTLSMVGDDIVIEARETVESAFFVDFPGDKLLSESFLIVIEVLKNNQVIDEKMTSFAFKNQSGKR